MLAPKRTVREISKPASMLLATGQTIPSTTDKLEIARKLASKINIAKNLGAEAKGASQQAAEAIFKGAGPTSLITAKIVAEQLAAKLNTKLNYQPREHDLDENEIEFGEQTFRKCELEINDFPQQARQ